MDETLSLIEKTAFLKSVPVLSSIPTEALAEVAARSQERHLEPGEVVFREGDANRGTFMVLEGMLQVKRGDAVVRVLTRDMAFGELWLGEGEPHRYTLVAVEHSHVLNVTSEDVFDTMIEYPEFGAGMVRAFALRIHELTNRILDLEQTIHVLHGALRELRRLDAVLAPGALESSTDTVGVFGSPRAVNRGPLPDAARDGSPRP
jgi:CRP-like cAMP-binding protein